MEEDFAFAGGIPPQILQMMSTVMPQGVAEMFGLMSRQGPPKTMATPPEPEEEESEPCTEEVAQCASMHRTSERDASFRDIITKCLIVNYEMLSPHCKCFVHHLAPSAQNMQVPQPAMAPPVRSIRIEAKPVDVLELEIVEYRPRRAHGMACILFMPLLFLAAILLVRRCCARCVKKPEFAVVVPPEPTMIKNVKSSTAPLVWAAPLTTPLVTVQVGKAARTK